MYFLNNIDNLSRQERNAINFFIDSIESVYSRSEVGKNCCYTSCLKCGEITIWVDREMVYPPIYTAPAPNDEMPEAVRKIYLEARSLAGLSPRAAAALLRVSLEVLTKLLGEKEGTLGKRIIELRKKGLSASVTKVLDDVRIITNETGAHAGVIDLNNEDNKEIVDGLFFLVNAIVVQTSKYSKITKDSEKFRDKIKKSKSKSKE